MMEGFGKDREMDILDEGSVIEALKEILSEKALWLARIDEVASDEACDQEEALRMILDGRYSLTALNGKFKSAVSGRLREDEGADLTVEKLREACKELELLIESVREFDDLDVAVSKVENILGRELFVGEDLGALMLVTGTFNVVSLPEGILEDYGKVIDESYDGAVIGNVSNGIAGGVDSALSGKSINGDGCNWDTDDWGLDDW